MIQDDTYISFRYSHRRGWHWPKAHEVHELTRHHWGTALLAFFLFINFSFASVILGLPAAAETDPYAGESFLANSSQLLTHKYRGEVPPLMAHFLKTRGEFAAAMAEGTANSQKAAVWHESVRHTKTQLLALSVPAALKEIHLGLVVAVGLDEMAADHIRQAYEETGALTSDAEDAFKEAEDRLTMVFQSTPWLTQ